jgi:hypothetical protein
MSVVRSLITTVAVLATTAIVAVVPANAQSLPASALPVLPLQSRCFLGGDDGGVKLTMTGGSATLDVATGLTFIQPTTLSLAAVDPATVPAAPGTEQDGLVVRVSADDACNGAALDQLPVRMTLAIFHDGAVSESGLVLARLDDDGWKPLPSTIDPVSGGRLISATVQSPGTYIVYEQSAVGLAAAH